MLEVGFNLTLWDRLPRFFDADDDVCPDCLSKGLIVDEDGEFGICRCMSFEPWAITWLNDVINRLVNPYKVLERVG